MSHYKQTLCIQNNTKFFLPGKTRVFNEIPSPMSYMAKVNKIQSYETRLYYEYLNCTQNDGQVFFFTLTYNDAHVPKYDGQPCFDYFDLRGFVTGGFSKALQRKYGIKFKYFISAELGDGKGVRGFHNNPHYHILFFTYPSKVDIGSKDYHEYVKINPYDFRSLVREYWQGFDQDKTGPKDFRKFCKYGIVSEGKYGIAVRDFRGIYYCAKYVTKDATLEAYEFEVEKNLRVKYEKYRFSSNSYRDFINSRLDIFDEGYIDELGVSEFDTVFDYNIRESLEPYREDYSHFCDDRIEEFVHRDLCEFRNRYSNKCRISNGVGDLALQYFSQDDTINVPTVDGVDVRNISLYYYRKKYTELVRKDGKLYRILNPAGIDMKVRNLSRTLDKIVSKVSPLLHLLVENERVYNTFSHSRFNSSAPLEHKQFISYFNTLNSYEDILQRYAVYKTVYAFRFFHVPSMRRRSTGDVLDFEADYRRFLASPIGWLSPYDNGVSEFLRNPGQDWLAYSSHPYFYKYSCLFDCLADFSDYLFVQNDDKNEEEARKRDTVRRYHTMIDISNTVLNSL